MNKITNIINDILAPLIIQIEYKQELIIQIEQLDITKEHLPILEYILFGMIYSYTGYKEESIKASIKIAELYKNKIYKKRLV